MIRVARRACCAGTSVICSRITVCYTLRPSGVHSRRFRRCERQHFISRTERTVRTNNLDPTIRLAVIPNEFIAGFGWRCSQCFNRCCCPSITEPPIGVFQIYCRRRACNIGTVAVQRYGVHIRRPHRIQCHISTIGGYITVNILTRVIACATAISACAPFVFTGISGAIQPTVGGQRTHTTVKHAFNAVCHRPLATIFVQRNGVFVGLARWRGRIIVIHSVPSITRHRKRARLVFIGTGAIHGIFIRGHRRRIINVNRARHIAISITVGICS